MTKGMYAKVAGTWKKVYPPAVIPPPVEYNEATGGTVTEYSKPDGTRWRVHSFTTNSTITVTKNSKPFRVLAVGGGGGGGGECGGGGGGGEVIAHDDATLPIGPRAVTVGAASQASTIDTITARGGAGGTGGNPFTGGASGNGNPGGGGAAGNYNERGGGGGGAGAAGAGAGGGGGNGGAGVATDIRGTTERFGGGGGGGASRDSGAAGAGVDGGGNGFRDPNDQNPSAKAGDGAANTGGGGGGSGWRYLSWASPGSGGTGLVVVSYEIEPPKVSEAAGGTETTVPNYNGTGHTYKVHTFTADGTLTVTKADAPFRVYAQGGGGGGGSRNQLWHGGGGAGGKGVLDEALTIPVGAHTVTVGAGGSATGDDTRVPGGPGGASSIGTLITADGGAGGQNAYDSGSGMINVGAGATQGLLTNVRDGATNVQYGVGGIGGENQGGLGNAAANTGNGGQGQAGGAPPPQRASGAGGSGIVVVAYRIG